VDDRELDKVLNKGKTASDNFFSHINYVLIGNEIKAKIYHGKIRKVKLLWSFPLKAGFVVAAMLVIVGITLGIVSGTQSIHTNNKAAAVTQQTVSFNGGKDCLISYIPVNSPDSSESSLMSVLWELNTGSPKSRETFGGINDQHSQMLYSTMFEKCDMAYPASNIDFPDTGRSLVLIFSGDSQADFIDYRLLGYNDDSVKVWWSQDFVPGGKLGVKDGVIIEQRASGPDGGSGDTITTCIIPYEIQITGELMLPVQNLQLRVGEQVLLVGSNNAALNIDSQNGLVQRVDCAGNLGGLTGAASFRAIGSGNDILMVGGINIKSKGISVNIS